MHHYQSKTFIKKMEVSYFSHYSGPSSCIHGLLPRGGSKGPYLSEVPHHKIKKTKTEIVHFCTWPHYLSMGDINKHLD